MIQPGLSLLYELVRNYRRNGVLTVTQCPEEMMRNGALGASAPVAVRSLGADLYQDKRNAA